MPILQLEHHFGQLLQKRPVRARGELNDSSPSRIERTAPAVATSSTGCAPPARVLLVFRLIRLLLGPLRQPEELQSCALRLQHSELARDRARLGRVISLIMRHIHGIHEHGLQRVQHVLPETNARATAARSARSILGTQRGRAACSIDGRRHIRRHIIFLPRCRSLVGGCRHIVRTLIIIIIVIIISCSRRKSGSSSSGSVIIIEHSPDIYIRVGIIHRIQPPAQKATNR